MPHIKLRRLDKVTSFRKLAVATWDPPRDPTVYGELDVDMTKALDYLKRKSEESGEKITITHLVGRCLAQCLREFPDANCMIRRSRFYQRETVDMFFQVAITGDGVKNPDDLSGVVVRKTDTKNVVDIARELNSRKKRIRSDEDEEVSKAKNNLQSVPPALLRFALGVLDFIGYELNIKVPGYPRDPFGSSMVTSMGMFGIAKAWAPLFPPSHCPIVLMVGAIERRPWVVNDEEGNEKLDIRDVGTLCVAFDHRIMDGVLGSRLTKRIEELVTDPNLLDELDRIQGAEG